MAKIAFYVFAVCLADILFHSEVTEAAGSCHQYGMAIKQGKTVSAPIGQCMQLTCTDASNNSVAGLGCATFVPAKGCRVSGTDLTKRYPKCCPKSICK